MNIRATNHELVCFCQFFIAQADAFLMFSIYTCFCSKIQFFHKKTWATSKTNSTNPISTTDHRYMSSGQQTQHTTDQLKIQRDVIETAPSNACPPPPGFVETSYTNFWKKKLENDPTRACLYLETITSSIADREKYSVSILIKMF